VIIRSIDVICHHFDTGTALHPSAPPGRRVKPDWSLGGNPAEFQPVNGASDFRRAPADSPLPANR